MLACGGLVPHPPILVPEIGRGELSNVAATSGALSKLIARMMQDGPDVVLMSGPHHPDYRAGAAGVGTAARYHGDFARFGAPLVGAEFDGAPDVAARILEAKLPLPAFAMRRTDLDWGFMVFLDAAKRAGFSPRILPLSITWGEVKPYYEFGGALRAELDAAFPGLKFAYVGSGDLSHCTRMGIGREYDPFGREFDARILAAVREWDVRALLALTEDELLRARQCGAFSFAAAMGFYGGPGAHASVLSYEDPFGVGYLVASLEVKDGSIGA